MADYCLQCSVTLGAPEGWSDMAGLFEDDPEDPKCVAVLCEGCGFTFVDVDGKCVGPHQYPHDWSDLYD